MHLFFLLLEPAVAQSRPAPRPPVSRPAPRPAPRPTAAPRPAPRPTTVVRPAPRTVYVNRAPVRHVYTTVPSRTVYVGVGVRPWVSTWSPPPRSGWVWVNGRYDGWGVWTPGHWASTRPAPSGYVYVDGFWQGDVYVDGWYRTPRRDGWVWVDTRYRADGSVTPGHWRPLQQVPAGYVWEPGVFDGTGYTDGFWRPAQRSGYSWEPPRWDGTSWSAGYWMPHDAPDGMTWEPGWFDGSGWVEGRWVRDEPPRQPPPPPHVDGLALPAQP